MLPNFTAVLENKAGQKFKNQNSYLYRGALSGVSGPQVEEEKNNQTL